MIEEDLVITDVSRRNTVFLVTSSGDPTLVVKQAVDGTAPALAQEARVLRALDGLGGLVPQLVHHEPDAARIVLRSPPGGVAWASRHGRRLPTRPARALGRALATVHAAAPALELDPCADQRLWGLSLAEPPSERVQAMSAVALDVLAHVQRDATLCGHLCRLGETVGADTFVHGDMRWDNCLSVDSGVLLIDWEHGGWGDAAADLGAALANYLQLSISSRPIANPHAPDRLAAHGAYPMQAVWPAMQALWEGYLRASVRAVARARVAEFVGVRLIETALEHAQGTNRWTGAMSNMLDWAANTLREPETSAWSLLKLRS